MLVLRHEIDQELPLLFSDSHVLSIRLLTGGLLAFKVSFVHFLITRFALNLNYNREPEKRQFDIPVICLYHDDDDDDIKF